MFQKLMAALKDIIRGDEPGLEEWVNAQLQGEESEFSGFSSEDGRIVAPVFESDHNTARDQSLSEYEEDTSQQVPEPGTSPISYSATIVCPPSEEHDEPTPKRAKGVPRSYFGKNRFKWSYQAPPKNIRTRAHNITTHLPGIIGPARQLGQHGSYSSQKI